MKLSVEGKVAASVAAAFVALTVGEIAQGDSAQTGAALMNMAAQKIRKSALT